ncbi:uncharacterized protein [Clytia hemisphaerica]|uniref:Uncharacterized protein n=1 Tax=Clytia hemisphaerica TaxID=252671 RepID=A0A7M5UAQ3_9CNID
MREALTLFSWFSGLLILVTVIIDILLAFKFRRYFRANGFGIVTLTLVSLVFAHGVSVLFYGITTLTIIGSGGSAKHEYSILIDLSNIWMISSTLLHMMGITLQRVFSYTYGNRFLQFTSKRKNIVVVILNMWLASLVITVLVLTNRNALCFSVFYLGVFICGTLTIVNFMLTVDTHIFRSKPLKNPEDHELAMDMSNVNSPSKKVRVVQTPRKTFSLFSGLLASFLLFTLPGCIPNLIFNLRGKVLSESTYIIISLWLFLGLVFDCLWILMRLRSTINSQTGFYARWTLRKSRENVANFFNVKSTGNNNYHKRAGTMREKLVYEDSYGPETEAETI